MEETTCEWEVFAKDEMLHEVPAEGGEFWVYPKHVVGLQRMHYGEVEIKWFDGYKYIDNIPASPDCDGHYGAELQMREDEDGKKYYYYFYEGRWLSCTLYPDYYNTWIRYSMLVTVEPNTSTEPRQVYLEFHCGIPGCMQNNYLEIIQAGMTE